ncbi:MAG: oligosaccharide flippase family protein [Bacteroidota bacterium]
MRFRLNTISALQFYQLVRYTTLIMVGVVFAKSELSQQAIGEYETFIFLAGAVSFFWLNGLIKALLPLSVDKKLGGSALFSSFILISIFSLLTGMLLFLLHPFISELLLNGREMPELSLLIVYLAVGVPANMVEYFYLVRKKNKQLVVYAVVSFLVQFLLIIVPVLAGLPVDWALRGLVASGLLRYLWLWGMFIGYREISFSWSFLKAHVHFGTPLVTAAFLSGSAQFVDGFIVTSRFDESTFAVFRYGARELPLAILLANALNSAMLPAFAVKEELTDNLLRLKKSVGRLMHFLFPLTGLLLLISHPVFPILFNPAFEESATIFNIYLLLVISRLLMPQTILNGLKHTRPIVLASVLELLLNVLLSLLFVQVWGIAGIAFATFVAYIFEKAYLVVMVKRKLDIGLSEYHPVMNYVWYSLGVIALFIFAETVF